MEHEAERCYLTAGVMLGSCFDKRTFPCVVDTLWLSPQRWCSSPAAPAQKRGGRAAPLLPAAQPAAVAPPAPVAAPVRSTGWAPGLRRPTMIRATSLRRRLPNSVLRQVAHVSLGGSQIRVQFSNLFGNGPVTINSAHVALCKATPAVDSTIDTATDKALAFSGTASVTIAQGKEVWSDPIDFTVPALGNITITTAFGSVPSNVVGHSGSRTTSYLQTSSSDVSAASMTSAHDDRPLVLHLGHRRHGRCFGQGRRRDWRFHHRRQGHGYQQEQSVDGHSGRTPAGECRDRECRDDESGDRCNQSDWELAARRLQARFNRDVLGQSGVRYAIVFDGVNDIGGGASFAVHEELPTTT